MRADPSGASARGRQGPDTPCCIGWPHGFRLVFAALPPPQLDIGRTGESGFLVVLCGSGYDDRRSDGISVVREGALGT